MAGAAPDFIGADTRIDEVSAGAVRRAGAVGITAVMEAMVAAVIVVAAMEAVDMAVVCMVAALTAVAVIVAADTVAADTVVVDTDKSLRPKISSSGRPNRQGRPVLSRCSGIWRRRRGAIASRS